MPFIRQCAWCRVILEDGEPQGQYLITHTICEPCCTALLNRAEMLRRKLEADCSGAEVESRKSISGTAPVLR